MPENWKWSFIEALKITLSTYREDARGLNKISNLLESSPQISVIKHKAISGLKTGHGQPVIFIHGSPANAIRWSGYLENTPEGFQFIAVDRMGFGQRIAEPPNLEKDTAILIDFIKSYENPIIVGHSLGGAIALRLATELKLKALVLVAASVDPLLERTHFLQKIGNSGFVKWLLSPSIRHSNEEMFQLFDYMVRTEKNLGDLKVPTYIIHTKDDFLVPFENINYMRKHIKNINIQALETGGHGFLRQTKEPVINTIKAIGASDERK